MELGIFLITRELYCLCPILFIPRESDYYIKKNFSNPIGDSGD